MNGILLRTFQLKDDMTKKEREVAEALLANPSAVITRTITEYAAFISSSTATITRFCNRLGISGFTELKLRVVDSLSNERSAGGNIGEIINLDTVNSTNDMIQAVVTNAMSSIEELNRSILPEKVEEAAMMVATARNIIVTGMGASALVAIDFHQKLTRLGILSRYDSDLDMQKVQLSSMDERDLLIAFSYSGMKSEVLGICHVAKRKKVKILSVTKMGINPISELSDLNLAVVPSEALVREGATVSRLQMLLIVDFIFQFLIHHDRSSFTTLMETWHSIRKEEEGPMEQGEGILPQDKASPEGECSDR